MAVSSFAPILEAACTRLGTAALEARMTQPSSPAELKALTDDRYLSQMSLRIFRAGLKHSLVDAKWPAFEDVFEGFEPRRVRAMSDEALEALERVNRDYQRHAAAASRLARECFDSQCVLQAFLRTVLA